MLICGLLLQWSIITSLMLIMWLCQAEVLASHYSDRLRFSTATDFIVYNDSYWEESKEMAQDLVHELTYAQGEEAAEMYKAACKLMKAFYITYIYVK